MNLTKTNLNCKKQKRDKMICPPPRTHFAVGKRKYPPLTPGEVVAILLKSGFALKRTHGDHAHYERLPNESDPLRRIVTVDMGANDFGDTLMKSMIEQSGLGRSKFYGATKRTAAKAGVEFLRVSNDPESE